jgi:hypothetical protein
MISKHYQVIVTLAPVYLVDPSNATLPKLNCACGALTLEKNILVPRYFQWERGGLTPTG